MSEDVMLIDRERRALASLSDSPGTGLGPAPANTSPADLSGCVLRLTTSWHRAVAGATAEARLLRAELITSLRGDHGLTAISAGTHPWSECPAAGQPARTRRRPPTEFAGILGRFDPLCGVRIAVAVPTGEAAVSALDGLRARLPLLLALSANSPFWRGRDTGLATTRTALRAVLPHTGPPRSFGSYTAYVEVVEALVHSQVIAGPSSIRWDACLRPDLGAVEVSVMDAQTRVGDMAGLMSLLQCLARLHAEGGAAHPPVIPEILSENRSVAAREGIRAHLIDPARDRRQPASAELSLLVETCAPIARELACSRELVDALGTAADPGHARQRALAAANGLKGLVDALSNDFAPRRLELVGS
jgi:glutamate---cysteine ligase / carboxylate-amine ligase